MNSTQLPVNNHHFGINQRDSPWHHVTARVELCREQCEQRLQSSHSQKPLKLFSVSAQIAESAPQFRQGVGINNGARLDIAYVLLFPFGR